ncbi:MAG: SEC-C metal-binding domain-containing protein, partial [Sphaerochaetaceae bacterium]
GSLESRARALCGSEASNEEFVAAKNKILVQWQKDYDEVKALGGLYILGTERHESRRIDNQLRGRSGRQGDPGVSRFYLSLDDTLLRLFAKDSIKTMLGRIGMGAEPIEHSMVSRAIEKAQKRVEEQNFEIRKHLLEYDDVLNEQRNYIYSQRDSILRAEDLVDRGLDSCKDMVTETVDEIMSLKEVPEKTISRLRESFFEQFNLEIPIEESIIVKTTIEPIVDHIYRAIQEQVNEKVAITGVKPLNDFLRMQYLRQIDMRWQEHLDQLEALREAVYLRTYAQKNPLLEYKLEGFQIFDSMINEIKRSIARMLVRVRIQADAQSAPVRREPVRTVETHNSVAQQFSSAGPQRVAGSQQGPHPVQIVRTGEKIGRNDPCPCGSGKKYKHCHGA